MRTTIGKWIILISGCAAIGLISFIDWITAQKVSLYVFYAVPIFFGAWFAGRGAGIVFCFVSVFAWMVVDLRLGHREPVVWNAGLRLGFFIGISMVITWLKSSLEREKARAGIDYLTALPNRRTFFDVANQERERAVRHKHPLTVAYIDLDDFKEINDRSGHDIGDLLLKEIGFVLKQNVRASDTVARIGGDEFVVLFPETGFGSAQAALQKLEDEWTKRTRDKQWNISISIGAVTYADHFPEVKEMVRSSDRLMYAAKASGKNKIVHELGGLD